MKLSLGLIIYLAGAFSNYVIIVSTFLALLWTNGSSTRTKWSIEGQSLSIIDKFISSIMRRMGGTKVVRELGIALKNCELLNDNLSKLLQ